MKKLASIAFCGLAAATFALPTAADDAKARAGANASVEGGAVLGDTGMQNAPRSGDNAGAGKRTGDAQARRDNNEDKNNEDKNAKPEKRAKRKQERDASSGASGSTY